MKYQGLAEEGLEQHIQLLDFDAKDEASICTIVLTIVLHLTYDDSEVDGLVNKSFRSQLAGPIPHYGQ